MMRGQGFTFIELLVALAIFAVLSLLAYGGLASVLDGSDLAGARAARLGELQRAVTRLADDLAQVSTRPVRDAFGDPLPALASADATLELTHGGWRNPTGQARSTLQRVGYAIDDGVLVRRVWPVLDRAPDSLPLEQRLLTGTGDFALRFLAERGGRWESAWPPAGSAVDNAGLPLAVEVTLEVDGFDRISRLVITGE